MRNAQTRGDWYEVSLGAMGAGTALWLALTMTAGAQTVGDPSTTLQKPEAGAGSTAPSLPSTGENLSERLGKSDGVISPPAGVDRDMTVAPREPGAGSQMPVIPPSQVPPNPPRSQ